jgi:hypothetical protein
MWAGTVVGIANGEAVARHIEAIRLIQEGAFLAFHCNAVSVFFIQYPPVPENSIAGAGVEKSHEQCNWYLDWHTSP